MKQLLILRFLSLAIALFGYVSNGAQAHVRISGGETLELMLCGTGDARSVQINIPGEPIEELEETCCGNCTAPTAMPLDCHDYASVSLVFAAPIPQGLPVSITPRSPLWPGAPPQGPPMSLIL